MLRGGIIGLGNVALRAHLPGWHSRRDVEVVAATDVDPARESLCARHLPGSRWYATVERLLDDADLDFVDICTPPSSHATLIRGALARGLHVLCEKPLVRSPAELHALVELAASNDLVLHAVHNWHHAPIVRQTRELVAGGAIGPMAEMTWQTLRTRPAAVAQEGGDNWRVDPDIAGGGVLTDHGWHVTYILHRWIGAMPVAVSARLETRRHTGFNVEDTASLRLRFPDATAEVLLTWASDQRNNWARLTGTEGTIEILDDTLFLRNAQGERRWSFAAGLSDGSQHPEWFHAVADQFIDLATGESTDETNLNEASLCVAVEALARESHRRDGEELPLSLVASFGRRRQSYPSDRGTVLAEEAPGAALMIERDRGNEGN
ncbi:MAG TPA: Gfo/Idh/MocA family oxidoreductase [Candidatus Methylomirabilis sp.]|nr:Gfo/Idh/MocA family oxidoreductase [Candidatus Methylomirabilis sp.]